MVDEKYQLNIFKLSITHKEYTRYCTKHRISQLSIQIFYCLMVDKLKGRMRGKQLIEHR